MHIRLCPECQATEVHRSRRKGLWEHTALRLMRRRPYRCFACGHRFYDHPQALKVMKKRKG